MQDSIFTKIIKGDIPSYRVYEDDRTYAFLDIHPNTPGHVLVVPKAQVEFLWDLEDNDYQAVMQTAKKVARHLKEVLSAPYVGVKVIGVDVPHAHVHLLPFENTQQYRSTPDQTAEPDHVALAAMAEKIRMN
jgi:histidine triad (HIT) family protein